MMNNSISFQEMLQAIKNEFRSVPTFLPKKKTVMVKDSLGEGTPITIPRKYYKGHPEQDIAYEVPKTDEASIFLIFKTVGEITPRLAIVPGKWRDHSVVLMMLSLPDPNNRSNPHLNLVRHYKIEKTGEFSHDSQLLPTMTNSWRKKEKALTKPQITLMETTLALFLTCLASMLK